MNLVAYSFSVVDTLSVLVVLGHLIAVLILAMIVFRVKNKTSAWFTKNALILMFIVALVSTVGSLFFSEIAGWNPCKYCWIQRIFMYPQLILLGIAVWKKDTKIAPYILALSIIGFLYATYHYYIQLYDIIASPTNPATPCDASGESCVKTPFINFGYITIPMMAWTGFLLNGLGSVLLIRKK